MKIFRDIAIKALVLIISAGNTFAFIARDNICVDSRLRQGYGGQACNSCENNLDELGSTIALTDEDGIVTDQYAYMPYGTATHTGNTTTPFQWLGGYGVYYDHTTELHLTLHRAYSADLKKFISADPLGIDGGVNVYAYANLNPLAFVDPYGLCGESSESGFYQNFVQNTTESPFNPFYWANQGQPLTNDIGDK